MANKKALLNRLVAKVVDGESGVCAFCHQTLDDEIAFGKLYCIGDLYCHYFCVLLSSCLIQKGRDEQGLLGFLYPDIQAELERSKKHKCSFCGKDGATLGCTVSRCRKQFHLPCGRKRGAMSLFYGNFKSFCAKHAPHQKIDGGILQKVKLRMQGAAKTATRRAVMGIMGAGGDVGPGAGADGDSEVDMCVICYERVDPGQPTQYFWPPCCARDARFHRHCLERMALSAGIHFLKCPLCNDKDTFYKAVLAQGYYVPDRDAAWELEQNAFADMYRREVACTAERCACPQGPSHDEDNGVWEIKLCLLCGGFGIHAQCLPPGTERNICGACLPAAPDDLQQLEAKILQVQEEQERAVQTRATQPPRRVMPSRMSLRRNKGQALRTTASDAKVQQTEPQTNTAASRLELNLKPPRRPSPQPPLGPGRTHRSTDTQHIQAELGLMSPTRYLQEKLASARVTVDPATLAHKLSVRFKKPRPLSQKWNIVNAIFDELTRQGPGLRSPLRELNSPTRNTTPKSKEELAVETNSISLPSPNPNVKTPDTPQQDITSAGKSPITVSDTSPDLANPVEMHDESSNSTFQLPADFVAQNDSDDDLPIFDTPKKSTTVDIEKDSSMEISNDQTKIHIDVIKIDADEEPSKILKDVFVMSPEKGKKCSLKISSTDKEALEYVDIGIDVERFKSHYLNEVVKDFRPCTFNHNHDNKEPSRNVLMTPIDFAIQAVRKKILQSEENGNNIEKTLDNSEEAKSNTNAKKKKENETSVKSDTQKCGFGREIETEKGVKCGSKTKKNRKLDKYKNCERKTGVKRNKKHKPCLKADVKSKKDLRNELGDKMDHTSSESSLKPKNIKTNTDIGTEENCQKISLLNSDEKKLKIENTVMEATDTLLKRKLDVKCTDNDDDSDFEPKKKRVQEFKKISKSKDEGAKDFNCEFNPRRIKGFKKTSRAKDERKLKKLNKKRKNKYLLKCKGSVKIKFFYNEEIDDDIIDMTVKEKRKKKMRKKNYSSNDKEIKLQIMLNKKNRHSPPSSLTQTVLNFSPENGSQTNCLLRPPQDITPIKKRNYVRKELSTDSLKQTSIQNFFIKMKSPVKEQTDSKDSVFVHSD